MKNIEVVAAIIYKQDQVLITQRAKGKFKGLWEFPGGKIETGETHQEALVREIKEELQVNIEVKNKFTEVEYQYEDFYLKMYLYWARIVSGEINLVEHMDMQWVNFKALKNVNWLPADIKVGEMISNLNAL